MQEAWGATWTRETNLSAGLLESVRELNHRFLDLVTVRTADWSAPHPGFSLVVAAQIAPLSADQKAAAANCPYALFDLRFRDDRYWQARLRSAGTSSVAEEPPVDANTLDFVRLALFFVWHVASSAKLAAPLLFGMPEATAAAFRGATIDCVPFLAASEAANLTARWNDCAAYWRALAQAASRPDAADLRRIQLSGLQLAAADRLV